MRTVRQWSRDDKEVRDNDLPRDDDVVTARLVVTLGSHDVCIKHSIL